MLVYQATTAPWHELVFEAEEKLGAHIDEEIESYLVFMLMRHLRQPELARSVIALGFLEGLRQQGKARTEALQRVGDHCLLLAGLFPEQARRRCVGPEYFVHMGRNAYGELWSKPLFVALARHFVLLADILSQIRAGNALLKLPHLYELQERWENTGSRFALEQIAARGCTPVKGNPGQKH